MSLNSFLLLVQQDPRQHSVSFSELMANSHDRTHIEPAAAGRTFMRSVTIDSSPPSLPVHQKSVKTEFKIDYQVRRDNKGRPFVHKVYLPSTYKGWAIMAEREDTASPRFDAWQPDISIKAEKPSEDHQEPSAEDPHDVPVPEPVKHSRRRGGPEYRLGWWAKFNKINGVVLPSTLKPGQPPIKTPYGPIKDYVRLRTRVKDKGCPICRDWFSRNSHLKAHFIHCVGRNGNPQGYYWNGVLDGERRIGKEIAELYCRRDGGGDQDIETSTSDGSSSDDPHTTSYEPSESCSYSQPSSSRSPAVAPSLRHDPDDHTRASSQTRSRTHLDYEKRATGLVDEEVSHSAVDIPRISPEDRAEMTSKATKLRGPQEHIIPMRYDNIKRAWVLTTPETAEQHESEANRIGTSGHENVHGGVYAIQIVPKTMVPRRTSQGGHTNSNAYTIATTRDFGVGRSPGPSPGNLVPSLTNPASHTNQQFYPLPKPLLSSQPSGAKKRQAPSEPSPLSQGSKRQRMLPSELANLLQAKTAASPSRQSEKQGPQFSPASTGGPAPSLSRNGPISGEKMDGDHVGVRQSKGAGLRINTKVAESAAPPLPGIEPTFGEKLYADYVKSHKEFRRELDNLAHELNVANKRANTAESRAQTAESMVYQANNAGFMKLKTQEDRYRKENEKQQRECISLMIYCKALELSVKRKTEEKEALQRQLEQERQMSVIVRSEHAKTVEMLGIRPVVQ